LCTVISVVGNSLRRALRASAAEAEVEKPAMILQAKTTEARRVTGNEDAALVIVPVELGEIVWHCCD
jgi:hypothetical protein